MNIAIGSVSTVINATAGAAKIAEHDKGQVRTIVTWLKGADEQVLAQVFAQEVVAKLGFDCFDQFLQADFNFVSVYFQRNERCVVMFI